MHNTVVPTVGFESTQHGGNVGAGHGVVGVVDEAEGLGLAVVAVVIDFIDGGEGERSLESTVGEHDVDVAENFSAHQTGGEAG